MISIVFNMSISHRWQTQCRTACIHYH